MALTSRTNGSGGSNIIQAAWFNDFMNLLTGSMSDQPVTINNGITLKQDTFTTPTAPSLALATGTALGIGSYTYGIAFQMGNGQTVPGTTANTTTTSGNQSVNLSSIATGPTGTTARLVYRSKVGTTSPLFLAGTVANNTTTTFSDTTADASLTSQAPAHDSFGGYLQIQNQSGAVKGEVFSDGAVSFDAGAILSDGAGNVALSSLIAAFISVNTTPTVITGATSGTATCWQVFRGTLKATVFYLNGFRNGGGTDQTWTFPVAFTSGALFLAVNTSAFHLVSAGTNQAVNVVTGLASGGGTTSSVTLIGLNSFGDIEHAFDTLAFASGQSSTHTGWGAIVGI